VAGFLNRSRPNYLDLSGEGSYGNTTQAGRGGRTLGCACDLGNGYRSLCNVSGDYCRNPISKNIASRACDGALGAFSTGNAATGCANSAVPRRVGCASTGRRNISNAGCGGGALA